MKINLPEKKIAIIAKSRKEYDSFLKVVKNRKDFIYATGLKLDSDKIQIVGFIDLVFNKDYEKTILLDKVEEIVERSTKNTERIEELVKEVNSVPKWVRKIFYK